MVHITLLALVFWLYLAAASPFKSHVSDTTDYPLPNKGNVAAHDPNILRYNNHYYMFKGGVHLPIFKAPNLDGPWERIGTVLDSPSIIQKQNRTRPWAPTVAQWKDRFYCFYAVSKNGKRNSAIGLASSDSIEPGSWTDHGALIHTGSGPLSDVYPYNVTNAIDPAFFVDPATGRPYLQYGSYWDGIFQVPLTDDLSVENPRHPAADHLVCSPDQRSRPNEGSFMSYRAPYYYIWFSHGQCCRFNRGFPQKGNEYGIRVGRSTSVHGPFVDRDDTNLLHGGGSVVYGSNHGEVYAPGGLGILAGTDNDSDILYYHYLDTRIGFGHEDARLGWNYLDYVDGWPVPRYNTTSLPGHHDQTR
ncbi:putative arabinan endo-1,5-alpha-L-arabinosidase D [Aspergillus aurantiobrunneus]